jgi:hypothetical protein
MDSTKSQGPCGTCGAPTPVKETGWTCLRCQVIEAAKAWSNEVAEEMEWMKNNPNPNVIANPFLLRMYLTTKALLAAEKGE